MTTTMHESSAAVLNDELVFAREDDREPLVGRPDTWKLVIADDEEEVHALTRMVLEGFTFEDRALEFLSAYSGREARVLLEENPDTAVLLLDVVMEREDAGLSVVRHVRDVLKNRHARIILRTGHPGQAPEQEIVSNYDINDYKSKTELTTQKLYTSVTAALRSYRDIRTIERSRQGLEMIIGATGSLFGSQALERFLGSVLQHLSGLAQLGVEGPTPAPTGFGAVQRQGEYAIVCGLGEYDGLRGRPVRNAVPPALLGILREAGDEPGVHFHDTAFVGAFAVEGGARNLVYLDCGRSLSDLDRDLMQIYAANVGVAFDNIYLNREIEETQREVITTLGEVVDRRSQETALHTLRVGESAAHLARLAGLGEDDVKLIRLAAPMHDVGKIGISDDILNKPGKLTAGEYELMKTHTTVGHDILRNSQRPILQAAATIALQHHEKWDGSGYPEGLRGEEIHVFGRIVSLCDVFDALSNERVYRDVLAVDHVVEILRLERGRQFDPQLLDVFLEHLDDFTAIQDRHAAEHAGA